MSTATLSFLPSPVDLARQLAEADPGPDMIAMLGLLDPASLSPDDRLYVVQAWDRVCAWAAAQAQAAMAAFSGPAVGDAGGAAATATATAAPGEGLELGRDELAAALRLGRGTAQTRMDQARVLLDRLPATLALLESGDISERHAREIAEACKDLSLEQAAAVEARVLPRAPELTVAELRPRLRRAVAAADPQAFEVAHARAAKQRRVVMWPEPDGMATVAATLPAADAKTVFLALDSLARVPAVDARVTRAAAQDAGADVGGAGTRGAGTREIDARGAGTREIDARGAGTREIDARGIDARRADALLALATEALADPNLPQAHGRRVQVQVVMDPSTLLRFSEQPAELVGYGPIPASVARALAVDGMWQRLVVEPVTGHLLDYGETVYRPPQVLKDFLLARDVTCQFPGCRMPAYRSELDHIVPFGSAGGRTSASGMCALCKRHHQAKTKFGWQLERLDDGTLRWTSPEGRVYDVPQTDHRPDG